MKKIRVETKDKMLLTVDEAVALSGIGKNTMLKIAREHPEIRVKIGAAQKIKREMLETYVRESSYIEPFVFKEK